MAYISAGAFIIIVLAVLWSWKSFIKSSGSCIAEVLPHFQFTEHSARILKSECRQFCYLPSELKDALKCRVEAFLSSVRIEPGGGLEAVTERMKLVIAGQACLLLLGPRKKRFDSVRLVVVYPGYTHALDAAGHTYPGGVVALAWESVLYSAQHTHDGYNVVIHEFAHHFDFSEPWFLGVPRAKNPWEWCKWIFIIRREKQRLQAGEDTALFRAIRSHPNSPDPQEIFAMAVEHFIERPHRLSADHPELYKLLYLYFGFDPRAFTK